MDKTIKQKWLAALRSGEYKQGVGCLRSANDEFCCLGVLCDVVEPEEWVPKDPVHTTNNRCHLNGVSGMPSAMTLEVAHLPRQVANDLAGLNDRGKTFAEIANYIEEKL